MFDLEVVSKSLSLPVALYDQKRFARSLGTQVMTTRFNNATFKENQKFRMNKKAACVYCTPRRISIRGEFLYVIEMNNDENKIMGIGKIQNDSRYRENSVYSDQNYNRYFYTGSQRIDRANMTEEELKILSLLETLCFKGRGHLKRAQGVTLFPTRLLYQIQQVFDLLESFHKMFRT